MFRITFSKANVKRMQQEGRASESWETGKMAGEESSMNKDEAVKHWQKMSAATMQELGDWREKQPKATLREIEQELDEQIMKLRAEVLEEAAQWSEMRVWTESAATPICPDCQTALEFRLKGKRALQTHGGHPIELEREYGICPSCGQGFFPPR